LCRLSFILPLEGLADSLPVSSSSGFIAMKTLRLASIVLWAGSALCFAAFPTLHLKPVSLTQLYSPTNITTANDGTGRIFLCEQQGLVRILDGGLLRPTAFLDVSAEMTGLISTTYSERGLLGMAFHPGYTDPASAGYRCFYLNYTAVASHATLNPVIGTSTNCVSVIAEFKVSATNPNLADPASKRIVLTYGQPQSNHNGGQLEFGTDGLLYIGVGDGGSANDNRLGHTGGSALGTAGVLGNGQDRRTLLGKILRIDPVDPDGAGPLTYAIPPSNPFIGQTQDLIGSDYDGAMRDEIYAYGMRNPWRFCFDKRAGGTNRMFCGDVGQGNVEEVDLIVSGGNYGWRYNEGSFVFDAVMTTNGIAPAGTIPPIAEYAHIGVNIGSPSLPKLGYSVTGGYVYRGAAIPALQGKYLFADYGQTSGLTQGRIMGLEETSPGSGSFTLTTAVPLTVTNPLSIRIHCMGEDESGELYIGTKISAGVLELSNGLPAGGIYKVVAASAVGTLNLPPSRDTSLFSENQGNSNSLGSGLFAGKLANIPGLRRVLLGFDLSTVPPGASISAASLRMTANKIPISNLNSATGTLHRVTSNWAEGQTNSGTGKSGDGVGSPANPGASDATWSHANYDSVPWTAAGGDYVATASATLAGINMVSSFTWTSAQLAADVQAWLSTPASNHGWILRLTESTIGTARRFASREEAEEPATRPQLTLNYAVIAADRFREWIATYHPTMPVGGWIDPEGDDDGDGIKNQVEYAYGLNPVGYNPSSVNLSAVPTATVGGTTQDFTFRRDPRALDLIYQLQVSSDLVTWTTIVTSSAGGTPTGVGYQSESTIVAETPMKLVSASQFLATGSNNRNFVRLKTIRQP
jgi:glucose/arabinose dehydrogenase